MTHPVHGPPRPFRFVLAGAGRVGTAVAILLARSGHECAGVASRTEASARRAAGLIGAPATTIEELPPGDVALIGAPDGAVEDVCRALAPRLAEGAVAWHFAGSHGLAPLGPALAAGASGAALHPVQACPDVDTAVRRLPGSAWGVTCSDGLEPWASAVIESDLGGVPVPVAGAARPVWHAAAVTAANGAAALLAAGERMLAGIGILDPPTVLGPLAAGAVANAREGGGGAATLTGPVVRGDVEAVERHVRALEESVPDALPLYRAAGRLVLGAAGTRLDAPVAARLRALLEGNGP